MFKFLSCYCRFGFYLCALLVDPVIGFSTVSPHKIENTYLINLGSCYRHTCVIYVIKLTFLSSKSINGEIIE